MKRRGVTLIELLSALALTGFIVAALSAAFISAANFIVANPNSMTAKEAKKAQVDQLERYLSQAYLTPDATDSKCYFIASSQTGASAGNDTLTFTTVGVRPDGRALTPNTNDTFEDLNSLIGPQGGIAEVSFSIQAVGEGGSNSSGLFMRVQ
ncbi:MAG: prepilin-type N-terminal cleavage/methylation domain-containing protein, partial [Armatimonadota bacterium]